jgi:aminopeptidase-like protein
MTDGDIPAGEINRLVDSIFPFDYSIAGKGNDEALIELCRHLDFSVHSYSTGMLLNGWKIPSAWELKSFEIYKGSELLLRTTDGSFYVARNSPSIDTTISFDELMIRTNRSLSGNLNDLVYDWRNLYQNTEPDWHISLSENFISKLDKNASYRIIIDTNFYDSDMHVLTYDTHPESKRTLIINAHNCHPFQANDDVSGVAAAILIAQKWKQFVGFDLNVRLIIAPEIYGPLFYLNQFEDNDYIGALLLKGIGNRSDLKIQSSLESNSELDKIFWKILKDLEIDTAKHPFRSYYGNDEIVFENPPYCIPSITLTRIPYPEYHTSSDTPDIIAESSINEVVKVTLQALEGIAMNFKYVWKVNGLQKLSEPGLNLYKPVPAQGIHKLGSEPTERKWNILMNSLPGLISRGHTALSLSERFDLPLLEVSRYLSNWQSSGFMERLKV